jgi:1-aminocyclopropane-1-carboxylate deaminase
MNRTFVTEILDENGSITEYHFGGYGKVTQDLVAFINEFYEKNKIPLDPIYTGKIFGVMDR